LISASGAVVITDNLSLYYPQLLNYVMGVGDTIPSRIGETREILNLRLELLNPRNCVVGRAGFSESFMDEEITQLIAGVHDNDRLRAITPQAADLITAKTAYGPRTWEQLNAVENELRTANSRRAVVYIGRPEDLVGIGDDTAGEMPCTETWQFHARDGRLHMTVTMRSWDLVWGLSYDVPSFVAVQEILADSLGLEVGTYVHNAGSGHIYSRHYEIDAWPVFDGTLDLLAFKLGSMADARTYALSRLNEPVGREV